MGHPRPGDVVVSEEAGSEPHFGGFGIVGVTDCVDAFTQEDHEQGLAYLAKVYGARLRTTAELLAEWGVSIAMPQVAT